MAEEYLPPVGFYFKLSLSGEDAAFKEASGMDKELEVETIGSGGENRFKFRLPTRTKFNNLVLKRGLLVKSSKLATWCKDTLDGGLALKVATKNLQLSLLDENAKTLMMWNFVNAYPVKWQVSDFKSQESELVIETIELAYNYFTTK